MIGFLQGRVKLVEDDTVTLVHAGDAALGYEVRWTKPCQEGDPLQLWIWHQVTEHGQRLFGFESVAQRGFFDLLAKKLGPVDSHRLVMEFTQRTFAEAILDGRLDKLRLPGIGPKTLDAILFNFTKAAKKWAPDHVPEAPSGDVFAKVRAVNLGKSHPLEADLVPALVGMGFDRKKVVGVVAMLPQKSNMQDAMVLALRELAPQAKKVGP